MLKTTLSLAALLCTATFASAAQPLSETVRVGDLDVSSDAGVQELYSRLEKAAYRICRDEGTPTGSIEFTKCRRQVVDQAVADANLPELTAHHNPSASDALSAG